MVLPWLGTTKVRSNHLVVTEPPPCRPELLHHHEKIGANFNLARNGVLTYPATSNESMQSAPEGELRFSLWPRGIGLPTPSLKDANYFAWLLFLALLAAPALVVLIYFTSQGKLGDFAYFYGDGMLANQQRSVNLYNWQAQQQVFQQLVHHQQPGANSMPGPSPYPPFVALFFGLFARLPAKVAILLWVSLSLALYVAGVRAVLRLSFANNARLRSFLLCCALAFPPFFIDALANGQLSAIAVFALGMAIAFERHMRPYRSGLFLSILVYKPTLLLVLLPMLLLTRRFKALAGFATGSSALVLVSTIFQGLAIWPAYWKFLQFFRHLTKVNSPPIFFHWQFIDFSAFCAGVWGTHPGVAAAIRAAAMLPLACILAVLFLRAPKADSQAQNLVWAATLCWTLLLNVYVPFYDGSLFSLAFILTAATATVPRKIGELRVIVWAGLAVFTTAFFSKDIAEAHGVQIITLAIAAFGLAQLVILAGLTFPRATAPSVTLES